MMASHNKRTFIPAVIGFIATIRDGHPTTPIVVTSPIFSRPRESDNPAFASMPDEFKRSHAFTLVQHREALQALVAVLRARGDDNINYRSGLDLFGEADEPMLPDLLHPNGDGCVLQFRDFTDLLRKRNAKCPRLIFLVMRW